jgi:hypothetical protein
VFSRFGSNLKALAQFLIELIRPVYLRPAKYLAYNPATRVVSCKGCLPASVKNKKVNLFKLIVNSTFTPAPPLPPVLPITDFASKDYLCKDRPDHLVIGGLNPDSIRAEVVNHCALSQRTALFTLLIIYQVVGETNKRWFYFDSEAVNCQGRKVVWMPAGLRKDQENDQEVDESGRPLRI